MPTVLAVMAHPDDIEFTCAGTLALLKRAGWTIHTATMTAGDLGSATLPPKEIGRIRQAEAKASAALLGAGYTCLGFGDLTVSRSVEATRRASALIRQVRPDLLLIPPPVDYMMDHSETGQILREAAFASTIPSWKASLDGKPPSGPCLKLPVIYYVDPIDHVDHFGRRIQSTRVVDITDVIDVKEAMLAKHDSQRSWLKAQHGEDEYLAWMRRMSADRARDFKRKTVKYAEGFRQHLGHAFPKADLLISALGARRVKVIKPAA